MKSQWRVMICVGLMAMVMTGCVSSRVAWVDGTVPQKPSGFNADVRFSGDSSQLLNAVTPRSQNDPLEVAVSCRLDSKRDGVGFFGSVNNILSYVTLCIWPHVSADDYDYTVTVSGYGKTAERKFSIGRRSWKSFLLPVAAIPCPGWGDWRSWPSYEVELFGSPEYRSWREGLVAGYVGELMTDAFVGELSEGRKIEAQRRVEGISLLRTALNSSAPSQGEDRRPVLVFDEAYGSVVQRLEGVVERLGVCRIVKDSGVEDSGAAAVVRSEVGVPMLRVKVSGRRDEWNADTIVWTVELVSLRDARTVFKNEYYERQCDLISKNDPLTEKFQRDLTLWCNFPVVGCAEDGTLAIDMPSATMIKGEVVDLYSRESLNGASVRGEPLFQDVKVAEVVLDAPSGNVVNGKLGQVKETSRPWQNVFVRKRKDSTASCFLSELFKRAIED